MSKTSLLDLAYDLGYAAALSGSPNQPSEERRPTPDHWDALLARVERLEDTQKELLKIVDTERRHCLQHDERLMALEVRSATRPEQTAATETRTVAGWICNTCQAHNQANRLHCRQCDFTRPPTALPDPPKPAATEVQFTEPDWICSRDSCGARNYAFRARCRICGHSRPSAALPETPNKPSAGVTPTAKEPSDPFDDHTDNRKS